MNLNTHPYYFGVYANMARHNVFMILNDIAAKTGIPIPEIDENKEEELFDGQGRLSHPVFAVLSDGADKVLQKRVIELLYYHFPMLNALSYTLYADNASPLKYYETLERIFYNLEQLRNFYTHAHHKPVQPDMRVFAWMEKVFDDARDEAKRRFNLDTDSMITLYKWWGGKKKENKAFRHRFTEHNTFTEKGLAFFLCLFLEKEHIYKFLKNLQGFEGKISPEVYSIHRCRLPHHRLSSDSSKDALLLDMLNELQRCPGELYDLLRDDDKAKFVTKEEDEGQDIPESVLFRKQNRFPYFALRYIDFMGVFSKLRPQVDMGKYIYHAYKKPGPDKALYTRRWEKNIHVFANLSAIEADYPAILDKVKKDPSEITDDTPAPYLVATNPHYHFVGNNISFSIAGEDAPIVATFRNKKAVKTEKEIYMPVNKQPDITIATDELQNIIFYDYLSAQYKATPVEGLILDYRDRAHTLLKDVMAGKVQPVAQERILNQYQERNIGDPGLSKKKFKTLFKERKGLLDEALKPYGLRHYMVPDKLCRYLMGVEQVGLQDKTDAILREMKLKNDELLERIEDGGKERSKKSEKIQERMAHLKAGERATFLAEDMLYLQPHTDPQGKDAPNSDEYRMLQAALAFFSRDKEHIARIFLSCRLTHSKNPHPFLHKVDIDKCKTNIDFYKQYLKQRGIYLDESIKANAKDADYYTTLSFLHLKKNVTDEAAMKAYTTSLLAMPLGLPRGLFKDAVVNLVKNNGSEEMKQVVASSKGEPNVVYLLQKYYELLNDNSQPFYSYKRNYRTVDEWFDKRDRKDKKAMLQPIEPQNKTTQELTELAIEIKNSERKRPDGTPFYKVYSDKVIEQEKLIRHFKVCDQVLFIMCRELANSMSGETNMLANLTEGFLLKNIIPGNAQSILNKSIPYKLPKENKFISDTIKIKDYGKFRRFLKDRRLKNMLTYFNDDKVTRDELRAHLDVYERRRVGIFKAIYEFEQACGKNSGFKDEIGRLMQHPGRVAHKHLTKKYQELKGLSAQAIQHLDMIRNAFAHNQFPAKDKIKDILDDDMNFVEQLAVHATSSYGRYKAELEELVAEA